MSGTAPTDVDDVLFGSSLFLLVNAAAYRLRAETGSSVLMIGLATLVTAVVLVAFSVDALRNAPQTFTAMLAIGVLAVVLDAVCRRRGSSGSSGASVAPSAPREHAPGRDTDGGDVRLTAPPARTTFPDTARRAER